jgi:hypothetical protein
MKSGILLLGLIAVLSGPAMTASAQGDGGVVLDGRSDEPTRDPELRPLADDGSRITLSSGAEYSTGDFGDDVDTDIFYVPVSLKLERDHFMARVTVPFISIDGPGDVVGGTTGPLLIGDDTISRVKNRESGIGDVVGSLTYIVNPTSETLPILELTGKVKLPTADEDKGLGSGETDYTAQIDIAQSFGRVTPFATFGQRWLGDPAGVDLDDTLFGSLGFSLRTSDRLQVGFAFDYREASTSSSDDAREVTAFASVRLSDRWKLSPYVVRGLTDASPDYAVGFSISYRLR